MVKVVRCRNAGMAILGVELLMAELVGGVIEGVADASWLE